jgi:hypothetical protein
MGFPSLACASKVQALRGKVLQKHCLCLSILVTLS